eukprot:scaffold14655_cov31-Tisochrysis_lutea.AAC.3
MEKQGRPHLFYRRHCSRHIRTAMPRSERRRRVRWTRPYPARLPSIRQHVARHRHGRGHG